MAQQGGQHDQKHGQQNQQRPNQQQPGQQGQERNRQQQQEDERRGGSGNFANDPQRASEAGRKGGQH